MKTIIRGWSTSKINTSFTLMTYGPNMCKQSIFASLQSPQRDMAILSQRIFMSLFIQCVLCWLLVWSMDIVLESLVIWWSNLISSLENRNSYQLMFISISSLTRFQSISRAVSWLTWTIWSNTRRFSNLKRRKF